MSAVEPSEPTVGDGSPKTAYRGRDVLSLLTDVAGRSEGPEAVAWVDAVARSLADALLNNDAEAVGSFVVILPAVMQRSNPVVAEALDGILRVARAGASRDPQGSTRARLERGALPTRMLEAIALRPGISNRELMAELNKDETQVSRAGRHLLENGLASVQKRGRVNVWRPTLKGEAQLASLRTPEQPRATDPLNEKLEAVWNAGTGQALFAAATDLAALGVALRRSINPRGSLVRTASARLHPDTEWRLVQLAIAADEPQRLALLGALGEWGSGTARDSAAQMLIASGSETERYELVRLLTSIGGPRAGTALASFARQVAREETAYPIAYLALAGIEELATGGRTDATEASPAPRPSRRWAEPEADAAASLAAVLGDLDALSIQTNFDDLRDQTMITSDLIRSWADANQITPEHDRSSSSPLHPRSDDDIRILAEDLYQEIQVELILAAESQLSGPAWRSASSTESPRKRVVLDEDARSHLGPDCEIELFRADAAEVLEVRVTGVRDDLAGRLAVRVPGSKSQLLRPDPKAPRSVTAQFNWPHSELPSELFVEIHAAS